MKATNRNVHAESYLIRRAKYEELQLLPAIEQAASELFAETPYAFVTVDDNSSENIDLSTDRVWVAVHSETGAVVAFAIAFNLEQSIHLRELAVHPEHGRRGIGRLLIEAVTDWARELSVASVTLTTFSDVPWNGPYYESLGFVTLTAGSLPPELRSIIQMEADAGFPMPNRVCMKLDLKNRD